jgi:hypothetical protein
MDEHKTKSIISVFGDSDDHFFILRENKRKKDGFLIQKIDSDSLSEINSRTVDVPVVKGMDALFATSMAFGGDAYLICTADALESDTVYILAYKILDDLRLTREPITIGLASQAALVNQNGFRIFKNPSDKLVTVIIPREHEEFKNEKFEIRLFGPDFTLINSKELEVPHTAESLDYHDALIDSTNAIYVLAGISNFSLQSSGRTENPGRDFSLFKFDWETETLTEKSLSLGNKWLYDVRLLINDADNLQIAGFYSNMVDLIMAGTFSLEIDRNDGSILRKGLSPFDRDFRSKFRANIGIGSDAELSKFHLDYVYKGSDDRVILLSEKTYREESTVFNPATGTYSIINIYNYDEIILTSITPESKIDQSIFIPKLQSATRAESTYTSYVSFQHNGAIYLVYNDHQRNRDVPIWDSKNHRQITSATNIDAMLIGVRNDGTGSKQFLFNSSEMKMTFDTSFAYETKSGVVLLSANGYRNRFFKLLFP